jgi:anti-sigma regulatory factor (Ser/Thr protein kinase)
MPATGQEHVVRLELASTPSAVGWARRHTADVLFVWGIPQLEETATLVVSELVTNAIRYARAPGGPPLAYGDLAAVYRIALLLRLSPGRLVVEVYDPDPNPPVRKEQSLDAEGGRGLLLVESLSLRWNFLLPRGGGKVVWAELAVPEPERDLPQRRRWITQGRPRTPITDDLPLLRSVRDRLQRLDDEETGGS